MKPTFLIISDNLDKAIELFNKVIENKKVKKEQEHIKLDIIYKNDLNKELNYIEDIINKYNDEYIILQTNKKDIFDKLKTKNEILNDIDTNEELLIKKIIELDER